jgi:Tol biopolymer transport system component
VKRAALLFALVLLAAGCGSSSPSTGANGPIVANSTVKRGLVSIDAGGHVARLTSNPRDFWPTFSPDGAKIAFERVFGNQGASHLFVMNRDGSEQHQVGSVLADSDGLSWSPDGETIAFGNGKGIATIGVDGSGGRQLTTKGTTPAWSPDGKKIVFRGPPQLFVVNADGTGMHTFVDTPPAKGMHFHTLTVPAWSPDGSSLLFIDYDLSASISHTPLKVDLVDAAGHNERTIVKVFYTNEGEVVRPSWSPDGKSIVFAASEETELGLFTAPSDGGKQKVFVQGVLYSQPSWGPAGT